MTARFVEDTSIIKDNYVAVYCDYIGGEFVIEVTAKFPITTDIPFFYEIRGYYFDYGTSHEQQYGPDKTSVVLKKGGKAWRFVANPAGVPTGSPIYEVNWYTKMTQFSDDKYNYTGGYSSGIWK